MEYSGAGGKLIHEKNQKQKISWHCPFKVGSRYCTVYSRTAASCDSELINYYKYCVELVHTVDEYSGVSSGVSLY